MRIPAVRLVAAGLLFALLLCTAAARAGAWDAETRGSSAFEDVVRLPAPRALPLARIALTRALKTHGERHPVTAFWLQVAARLCSEVEDLPGALAGELRLLAVQEALDGAASAPVSETVDRVVQLYRRLDRTAEAIPWLQRLLVARRAQSGDDHPDTAEVMWRLAWCDDEVGRYSEARELLERALAVYERYQLPADEIDRAALLLGVVRHHLGDLGGAEALYRRVLESRESRHGKDTEPTIAVCSDLGLLHRDMGDLDRASVDLERATVLAQRHYGPSDSRTATTLANLAALRRSQRRLREAEALLYRVYGVWRSVGTAAQRARVCGNLGLVLIEEGRAAAALSLLEEALSQARLVHGADTPDVAAALQNLAGAWHECGRDDLERPLLEEALSIRLRVLGDRHPATAITFNNLAWLEHDAGRPAAALELARRAARARLSATADMLSFSSERQRLAWRANDEVDPYALFESLGSARDMAEAALRYKGLVLDSLLDDRAFDAASASPRKARIRSLREQLDALSLGTPAVASSASIVRRRAAREALQRALDDEEGALARAGGPRRLAAGALGVTLEQVQAALPPDAVLVEYLRFTRRPVGRPRVPAYVALVIGRNGVRAVSLGDAESVERATRDYRTAVRRSGAFDEAELTAALRRLYDLAWAPLEPTFGREVRRVYVSPDGMLNFVSFAILLNTRGQFVAEHRGVRYVSSGRDLVRRPAPPASRRIALFGDPRFGEEGTIAASREGLAFPRLAGTLRECEAVAALARARGWEVQQVTGAAATEGAVRAVREPAILHLATHGFLLPASSAANPMLRSGVALSGARASLEAWGRGEPQATNADGMLLAAEVGDLDLKDTWLVTLSACDTGLGEVQDGEGVLGLRRGFAFAGAENVLMTLWAVPDRSTAEFMTDFYRRLLDSGRPAADVLDEVQREWLVRLRDAGGLRAAVQQVGPFIITVRSGQRDAR